MGISKIEKITQIQINKYLNQQPKKKHKKEEKNLSFSDILRSINETISAK